MPDTTQSKIRPTKKQRLLLEFISEYITQHGYSPSYREIMKGCGYSSVATVALHVNNLIKRGHLQKRDRSARSLEVVSTDTEKPFYTNQIKVADEKWLVDIIDSRFVACESEGAPNQKDIDNLYVLVGSLRVLGIEGAAQSFMPRLSALKKRFHPN
jgi:SOS-response transcriptional repressor LexA